MKRIEILWDYVESTNQYPYSIPVFTNFSGIDFHPKVTFLIGENGSGKSTILEAIAVRWGFSAEGGSVDHFFKTRDSHSPLFDYLKLYLGRARPGDTFFLRAESIYNLASYVDEAAGNRYGGLHNCSHGESFLKIVEMFKGNGLYLMDEPEAALSPQRQLALLKQIDMLARDDSQFIIATHSPILLSYPNAKILQCSDTGISEVEYEDTEHFKITKSFLNAHKTFLHHLLGSEYDPR